MFRNGQQLRRTSCPGRPDLAAFHVGNLPADTLEAIATHLGTCDSCLLALEGLDDAADMLVSELRSHDDTEAPSEFECGRVATLLEDLGGANALPTLARGDLGQYDLLEE